VYFTEKDYNNDEGWMREMRKWKKDDITEDDLIDEKRKVSKISNF
jgi:hypothetical protein